MRSSKSLVALLLALAGLGGVSLSPAQARASQVFPGALQEAANMPCVPDCVVCHGVSPGTATTFTAKALGAQLYLQGARRQDTDSLKKAFTAFKGNMANAAAVAALAQGNDPQGGGDICTPTYGCAVTSARRSAQHSPPAFDVVAGGLALLTGLLLMRRRRS